jgi:ADP-heptose:LPS heptosyltransferase
MTHPERVLVIKLSALGDMILALPALARIRRAHPAAHITLLTTPPYEALAGACPWVDAVETDGRPRTAGAFLALVARLRRARYHRIYDLQGNDRTNLYFQALRPFPPVWSGVAFGCALPHRNPGRMNLHTLERQGEQLRDAGIWPDAPTRPGEARSPDVGWMVARASAPASGGAALAVIVPGASARRPRKLWPADRYGALARELLARGFEVVALGGAQDARLAAVMRTEAPGVRDLTGRTDLFDVAALGARARLAIGNDTGPLHILAAAGAPTVALFSGDSDPALCAPRGRVRILRAKDLRDLETGPVLAAALDLLELGDGMTS